MITRRHFASLLAPAAWSQPDLQSLYDAHDWLALAAAVAPSSSLLMRGAAAAALHRYKEAERLLRRSARENPVDAIEAHGHLINLYARSGQWRKAFASVQVSQRLKPDRADLQNAAALFGALARHPDQRPGRVRHVRLNRDTKAGGLTLPIAINGRPARYFWDTGANFSVTTESECRRLGMAIENPNATVTNSTGGSISFRLAIARELNIAGNRIAHVPFLVFDDHQQPFNEMEQEARGGIGLPVQLALRSMRWDSTGAFEFAVPNAPAGAPNLYFDGLMPCTHLEFAGFLLNTQLDTGASSTDLWPPFAKRFADRLTTAKREKRRVGGVGQNIHVESLLVDELPVRLGGKALTLKPAEIHVDKTDGASDRDYGRLGMDLLSQATRVTVDFNRMLLSLE